MPTPDPFLCAECCRTYPAKGFCEDHPDEPLLDTRDSSVIELLVQFDDRRRLRTMSIFALIGAILGLGLMLLMSLVSIQFLRQWTIIAGGATGLTWGMLRHRGRYRRWTRHLDPDQHLDGLEDLAEAKEIWKEEMEDRDG